MAGKGVGWRRGKRGGCGGGGGGGLRIFPELLSRSLLVWRPKCGLGHLPFGPSLVSSLPGDSAKL